MAFQEGFISFQYMFLLLVRSYLIKVREIEGLFFNWMDSKIIDNDDNYNASGWTNGCDMNQFSFVLDRIIFLLLY